VPRSIFGQVAQDGTSAPRLCVASGGTRSTHGRPASGHGEAFWLGALRPRTEDVHGRLEEGPDRSHCSCNGTCFGRRDRAPAECDVASRQHLSEIENNPTTQWQIRTIRHGPTTFSP
jgi:hypothetical protein